MNTIHLEYQGQNVRLALRTLPTPPEPPKPVKATSAGPIESTTVITGFQTLAKPTANDLIIADPEINMATSGTILEGETLTGVFVEPNTRTPVNDFKIVEVTTNPSGEKSGPKPVNRQANINTNAPIKVTKLHPLDQVLTKFVFKNTYQIIHQDGLSKNFLFNLAKTLETQGMAAAIGAGLKGNLPITLRNRSTPVRAFLVGQIEADKYKLLLLITDTELRKPDSNDLS